MDGAIKTQDVSGGFRLSLQLKVHITCYDSNNTAVQCDYQTGTTPGTPGPVSSNVIAYNTGGSTAASTAVFNAVPVYRACNNALFPATGTFTASYQLYTGSVYPGGHPIYVTNP